MPALRRFGIGCQKVSDATLSSLPQFPSLREITPVGFQDWGFRHIGRCEKLERLSCMADPNEQTAQERRCMDRRLMPALRIRQFGFTPLSDAV